MKANFDCKKMVVKKRYVLFSKKVPSGMYQSSDETHRQKEKRTQFRFKKVPFYGEKQKATFSSGKMKKGYVLDLKR